MQFNRLPVFPIYKLIWTWNVNEHLDGGSESFSIGLPFLFQKEAPPLGDSITYASLQLMF